MTRQQGFWFPSKRSGLGWGPPCTWQGWAVLSTHLVVVVLAVVLGSPDVIAPVVLLATAALVGIAYVTGEPPQSRWGR